MKLKINLRKLKYYDVFDLIVIQTNKLLKDVWTPSILKGFVKHANEVLQFKWNESNEFNYFSVNLDPIWGTLDSLGPLLTQKKD